MNLGFAPRAALGTRAERSQIIESVNSSAVAVLPVKFDRVVAHSSNCQKLRVGRIDIAPLRSMPLA